MKKKIKNLKKIREIFDQLFPVHKNKVKVYFVVRTPDCDNRGIQIEISPNAPFTWVDTKSDMVALIEGIFYDLIKKRKEWGLKPLTKKQQKDLDKIYSKL